MNTYTVGADYFCGVQDGVIKHCILGIYLAEKHGFSVDDGPQYWFTRGWEILEDANSQADIDAMKAVFGRYKDCSDWGDWPGTVNNMGAPLAILQEALEAVGIKVDLIEGRNMIDPEWDKWPDAVTQSSQSLAT